MRSTAISAVFAALAFSGVSAYPHLAGRGSWTNTTQPRALITTRDADHSFQPPGQNDSRTPCPGLNALANHGYIDRTGKSVGILDLQSAMESVYGVGADIAVAITTAGYAKVGQKILGAVPTFAPIDIHEFAQHNQIEHDASLAHADVSAESDKYAPTETDQGLLDDLIAHSTDGKFVTLEQVAAVRVEREAKLATPLDLNHQETAPDEAVLLLAIMGDGSKVSIDHVKTWLGGNQLPDDFKATRTQYLADLLPVRSKVRDAMASIRASQKQ